MGRRYSDARGFPFRRCAISYNGLHTLSLAQHSVFFGPISPEEWSSGMCAMPVQKVP